MCCDKNTTDNCDEYVLYEDIGMIPEGFPIIEVGDTTRSVCRQLCSETYNLTCSGFLYNRRLQKCDLSPYNGEWVTTAGLSFNSSSGLEFYRRRRCIGQIRISYFLFYIQHIVFG